MATDEEPRPSVVKGGKNTWNEKIKLTGTFLNGVALAVLTVGGFAPIVLRLQERDITEGHAYFAVGCLLLAGAIHLVARNVLEGMID